MNYEQKALEHVEKYGVIDYDLKGDKLIYYTSYPKNDYDKAITYKITIDLNTMQETRKALKRNNKRGKFNACM